MLNPLLKKVRKIYALLKAVYFYINARTLKGQYTIYAMFMTVLTLIAYIAVHPLLDEIISTSGITGIEGTLISWAPLFIILFILWSAIWYVAPYERR
jgi:hypothetical protein